MVESPELQITVSWLQSCYGAPGAARLSAPDRVDDIIDLEDAANRLASEGDAACADQQRLHHILLQDIGNCSFSHVDSCRLLSLRVSIPQLCHRSFKDNVNK